MLAVIVVVAGLLAQLPVLSWGWWSALGGTGNPVTGSTERTAGTVLESTRAHTAYNAVIIAVLLVALATGGLT